MHQLRHNEVIKKKDRLLLSGAIHPQTMVIALERGEAIVHPAHAARTTALCLFPLYS